MNKLIIKNDISQLLLDNLTLQIGFWKALRFRANNYFFNPAYKKRHWDGFVDFFSKKTGKFGTGLLPEVIKGLNRLHLKVEIDDQRTPSIPFKEIKKDLFPEIELYNYQVVLKY